MDLSSLAILAAVVLGRQGDAQEMRLLRFPAIHGDKVVFTYASDLWLASTSGGIARRLTSSNGTEVRARISPDGTQIAFTGTYDGNPDVYVMPIDGGEPKRLTFEPESDNVIGWTPDGKIMYTSAHGSYTNRQARLWMVSPKGGMPIETPVEECFDGTIASDGKTLYYQRGNSSVFNWRRYRGGTQGRVSIYNLETNAYSELPAKRDQSYAPMIVGSTVYYINDKNQSTLNLYSYDLNAKRERQLTQYSDADIKWPNTDGKSIVFERDGYLWKYDIASGKTDKLSPMVLSDNVPARPYLRKLGTELTSFSLSPSGVRIAAEARGEIFSIPARSGETRNMTNSPGSRERFPEWSPDGKTIAYISDESGNYEVYTQPQMGGPASKLTDAKLQISGLTWSNDSKVIGIATRNYDLFTLDVATKKLTKVFHANQGLGSWEFSPDSKWIAYINQMPNGFGAIYLYELATGKATQVTDGAYDDDRVTWDMNGKFLYFTSNRTFFPTFGKFEFSLKVEDTARIYAVALSKDTANPLMTPGDEEPDGSAPRPAGPPPGAGPIKIDFEGFQDRAIVLPLPAAQGYGIIGSTNGLFVLTQSGMGLLPLGGRALAPIYDGPIGNVAFNATRTKFAIYSGQSLNILNAAPGNAPGQGAVSLAAVEAVVDPRQEWRQIFWDSWRFERDNFYDPNMLGLDWKAIGDRYAKYLPYVSHRSDLTYVQGLLLGELGTGHSYVQGGDMGPSPAAVQTGQLGCDFEASGNYVRMKKIYRGANYEEGARGPLGEPGMNVKDGDYLLEIDGKQVTSSIDPNALLVGKAGRTVIVKVNSQPSLSGARTLRVRPLANETGLRYYEWVEANRAYVTKMSGGKIGYMHIPDTNVQGSTEFVRNYYRLTDKAAVIVDERFNGGGYIQPWFVDTLARKIKAGIQQRSQEQGQDSVAIEGPKCMLINGYAGSGGDFFPWMFRQAKLGPLIGKRTWGGLVGIAGGAQLIDGGQVTAPEFGIFDREKGEWIAENKGIDPDVDVDARPDLRAKGIDPQLDAALQYLQSELKKPQPKPKTPAFIKAGGG